MDAPAPKVKMSNLMRVLGDDAVANPSMAESYVQSQVAERRTTHEMENLARKLTPAERKRKEMDKIRRDAENGLRVCIYRIGNLDDKRKCFKVDVNARHYQLTGKALVVPGTDCSLVIVEGGVKSLRKFTKLMTRRIEWAKRRPPPLENPDPAAPIEVDDVLESGAPNYCAFVWQGDIAKRAFKNFRFEGCRNAASARKVLGLLGVSHYWDMAARHVP